MAAPLGNLPFHTSKIDAEEGSLGEIGLNLGSTPYMNILVLEIEVTPGGEGLIQSWWTEFNPGGLNSILLGPPGLKIPLGTKNQDCHRTFPRISPWNTAPGED